MAAQVVATKGHTGAMPHPFSDAMSFEAAKRTAPRYVQSYLARAARGDPLVCQGCAGIAGVVARMGPTTTSRDFRRAITSLNTAAVPGAVGVVSALSASLVDASASVSDADFMKAVAERVRTTQGGASVSLSIVWMALKQREVGGLPDEPPIRCSDQILAEIQRLMLTGDAAVLPKVASLMARCHHHELRVYRAKWGRAAAETQVILTPLQAELIQKVMIVQAEEVAAVTKEFVGEEERRRAVCCEGPFGMIAMALFAVAVAFASMFALQLYAAEMDSIAQASARSPSGRGSAALTVWQAPPNYYADRAARDQLAIAESMELISGFPEVRLLAHHEVQMWLDLNPNRVSPMPKDVATNHVYIAELIGTTAEGLAAADLPWHQRYRVGVAAGYRPRSGDDFSYALDWDEDGDDDDDDDDDDEGRE